MKREFYSLKPEKLIKEYRNFQFTELVPIKWTKNTVKVLNQLKLPQREEWITCKNEKDIAKVIKNMNIRGAPAIGVAAAMGFALGVKQLKVLRKNSISRIQKVLRNTRPTARNLFWALENQAGKIDYKKTVQENYLMLKANALQIHMEDVLMCRAIGENALSLFKRNFNILTHCNAGALATGDYGTALGVIRSAAKKYKGIHVYVDETRPYLQGSRLTAYELMKDNIPHTLICDNMAGFLMSQNKISCIVIGADRITANGDAANKIGSYSLAVLAWYHKIPYYIAAPYSTIDTSMKSGGQIEIEERPASELKKIKDYYIAPRKTPVYNPAFDVIPNKLITAIITEEGIFRRGRSGYKFK